MAWPCISRVCCLARFWDQVDKSDLAVPLTIHSYSDIDQRDGDRDGGAGGTSAAGTRAPGDPCPARTRTGTPRTGTPPHRDPPHRDPPHRSAPGGAGRDCGREGPPGPAPAPAPAPGPAPAPWPPSSPCSSSTPSRRRRRRGVYGLPAGTAPPTTSYRQEYRPWTGVKPSKPIKTKQTSVLGIDNTVRETSYRTDFKVPEGKTKFSPNPSAVFQAPARILNV
ncbi:MAP6 domain-containing protein 1 [Tachyglossus aculeatus]|uniref:MAP6 domain-containing protein 1 n=1 Tax=Tachyglossus aculeatus TaxID=9261 RepID=UPI0018F44E5E|nr:MAP6 domain-containing protein 1 [Tachyglossus aculeatus]